MRSWTQMKDAVEAQAAHDPQRAKLSERAWHGVEAGLQHLAGVGWNFEIVPKGTLQELVELREAESPTKPLSIADAKGIVKATAPSNPQAAKFDAMIREAPSN